MKRSVITTLTVVLALVALLGGACAVLFFGVPLGTEVKSTQIIGSSQDRQIVRKTLNHHRLFLIGPEGVFVKTYLQTTPAFELTPEGETRLPFLSSRHYKYELLQPVVPLASHRWAAFRLNRVTREEVDLLMHVFDRERLLCTYDIKNAKRVATSARSWSDLASYSVSRTSEGNIEVDTCRGKVRYDQNGEPVAPK